MRELKTVILALLLAFGISFNSGVQQQQPVLDRQIQMTVFSSRQDFPAVKRVVNHPILKCNHDLNTLHGKWWLRRKAGLAATPVQVTRTRMPSYDDDDERSNGSQDGSSDNDADETMRDIDDGDDQGDDDDGDGDGDGDGDDGDDGDGENDGEGEGADDDDGGEEEGSQGSDNEQNAGDQDEGNERRDSSQGANQYDPARDLSQIPNMRPEILTAQTYDIVPTTAAPQSTSINAICATADTRWVFTGGSDGYIRQYNWVDSINAKLALTVAQRHPFVDSVVKAGVLMTYWENYDVRPGTRRDSTQQNSTQQVLSPVYSLACHNQALWMLSGTASGLIRMQSVRHDEGREIAVLDHHKSAASVLTLSSDEKSLLSGSWDKTVLDWDLNIGKVRTAFSAAAGQISCIESRPISNLAVPAESGEVVRSNGTFSSNNAADPLPNGISSRAASPPPPQAAATPDSLFGGDDADDDLFGDSAGGGMANGDGDFGYGEDDEMTRAMADGPQPEDVPDQVMTDATDNPIDAQALASPKEEATAEPVVVTTNGAANTEQQPLANGLPHAEDMETDKGMQKDEPDDDRPITSDSTFLATSIDGAIRVWDRRMPDPVARIVPRHTAPWCLSACWSLDGNNIYAGRRNNTVDEYDLRKGLKGPERIFRFPNGSGAVTSVKAMPNGRHLICASYDILRLYDLKQPESVRSTVPFLIVPGHRTGVISNLYMDPACRFLMSTGGNRGWEGSTTEVILGYEINVPSSN